MQNYNDGIRLSVENMPLSSATTQEAADGWWDARMCPKDQIIDSREIENPMARPIRITQETIYRLAAIRHMCNADARRSTTEGADVDRSAWEWMRNVITIDDMFTAAHITVPQTVYNDIDYPEFPY